MGMFDTVVISCPKCNERIDFQSKAGDCLLKEYTEDRVPIDIGNDIAGNIEICPACNNKVKVYAGGVIPENIKMAGFLIKE